MKLNLLVLIGLGICMSNGHESHDSHTHIHSHESLNIETHNEHEFDFETINEETFQNRVVGYNYTQEKIGGKRMKYYITDNGNWHIDACSVIGNQETGLKGLFRRLADEENHRRLNPYWAGTVNGNPAGFWTNGILYYEIAHPTLNMGNFNLAKSKYESQSPVRLIEITQALKNSGAEWVRIIQGSGCWSYIGKVARGNNPNYVGQDLSLGAGCDGSLATIMHEFGHAFGFFHTQSRSDRDQHVAVNLANIRDDRESQYAIVYYPVCGTYDCGSMMHYRDNSFASCSNCKTMTPVNPNTCYIQRNYADPLSENDKYCLCELYAPGINGQTSSSCGGTVPAGTDSPTMRPTPNPSDMPTPSPVVIVNPTASPTKTPTTSPIKEPTVSPTKAPSPKPTTAPIMESEVVGFCLQGGSKSSSTHENMIGFWEKQEYGDFNQNTYYENKRLSCNDNPLYIYQTTSTPKEWYMSSTLNGNNFEAKCSHESIYDCHNQWQFNGIIDTSLNLIPGRCTQPGCEALSAIMSQYVNTPSAALTGSYTRASDNVYESSSYIIKYNDYYEQFIAYSIANKNNINDCDNTQSIIIGKSGEGVIPDIPLNVPTPFTWTGQDGAQAYFMCTELETTTTTVAPAQRPQIQCDDVLTGTLDADEEIIFDFTPLSGLYAMAFHSCGSSSTNGVSVKVRSQNLVEIVPTDNYGQWWCSTDTTKDTTIFWENNPTQQFVWDIHSSYALVIKGLTGGGQYRIDVWCYGSADALNFGKNPNGEYVPIFSFKAYGPVQWGIFFGVLIAIIIANIVGCYYVSKCMAKAQTKVSKDEVQLSKHQNNQQHNIELTPDDNDGIYGTR